MKIVKSLYWIVTGLMAAFMMLSAIPDLLQVSNAVTIFSHLGYPRYLLPFLGTAKTLGVIVVLVPGLPRLKEWAYAGLVFDVVGALYSHVSVGDGPSGWMPAVIGLLLISGAYLMHRMRLSAHETSPGSVFASGRDTQPRVA
jgi:ABC-type amino acid transport system permease subunit